MNDTHGATGEGRYAFDLDGVLAKYDGWKGIDHCGLVNDWPEAAK